MEDPIGHWDWFQQVLNAHLFFMPLEKWNDFTALAGFNGEGNGTPLQYSCLANPMDGGAW